MGQIILTVKAIAKVDQSINFGALPNKTYGDSPFTLTATSSSGLGITYSSSDSNVASISGTAVTILKAGSTTITASQSGNDNYNAATSVTQTLTVAKADQTITFGALSNKTYGDSSFALTATASSVLGVTYTSSDTNVASISGSAVTILKAGATTITAEQLGNNNFLSATPVERLLTVNSKPLTIGAPSIAPRAYNGTTTPGTVTVGALSGFAGNETVTATAIAANYPSAEAGGYNVAVTYTLYNGTGGGLASNYSLADGSATGTITALGTTFDVYFNGVNPTNVGSDGLTYLMKYALGGTNTNDRVAWPIVSMNGSTLTLTANVRTNDTNLAIVGQSSTDLAATWTTISPNSNGVASTNTNNNSSVPAGCQRRDFTVNGGSNNRTFLKLKVSQ